MKTTAAFPEPQHTQTPNNFFDMIPDMNEAELRVTLVMIRNTFGWHRNDFKMGVSKLAAAAGLSRQGALDGAAAAEERGTFRRANPDTIKEAEWELVVTLQSVDPSSQLTPTLQSVDDYPPTSGGQLGVKEKKESKEKPKGDLLDAEIHYKMKPMSIRDSIKEFFRLNVNWDTKTSRQWMEWAVSENITPAQVAKAADLWRSDKAFNWQVPTLKGIFEKWPMLMAAAQPPAGGSNVEETRKKIESEDWRKRS